MSALVFRTTDRTNPICSICLDGFDENREQVNHVDSGHDPFHPDCIRKWLLIRKSCPNDRIRLDPSSLISKTDRILEAVKLFLTDAVCAASIGAATLLVGCAGAEGTYRGLEGVAKMLASGGISEVGAVLESTSPFVAKWAGWAVSCCALPLGALVLNRLGIGRQRINGIVVTGFLAGSVASMVGGGVYQSIELKHLDPVLGSLGAGAFIIGLTNLLFDPSNM